MRSCPLCKHEDAKIFMKDTAWNNRDKVTLKKCNQCRFVYSSQFGYDYEGMGKHYLPQTKESLLQEAHEQGLPNLVDDILQKSKLKNGNVLDFGCGPGLSLLLLQDKGFTAYGIETSRPYLEKHKDLNIISTDSLNNSAIIPSEKECFDLILLKDVLEHVDNPIQLLEELLPYLKPAGYFYIRVPNVYHYSFHWSIDTKSHVNHFTPAQLMTLMRQQGMKRVDFVGVYDVSTRIGKLYNFFFWKLRSILPMYHQISLLYQKQ